MKISVRELKRLVREALGDESGVEWAQLFPELCEVVERASELAEQFAGAVQSDAELAEAQREVAIELATDLTAALGNARDSLSRLGDELGGGVR